MVSQMKGRGLSTHVNFVWIKRFRQIRYAVVMRTAYGRRQKQMTEYSKVKNCKMHLTKQMICIWLSVINTNMYMF